MKRKEPTGGTAAEDEGSRLLRVAEQQEASNFLNALPDLALHAVLDFLQRQEARALRVDGMQVVSSCMKCKRE